MKGKFIAEGYTAEVFEWGEKEIIKLFRQSFPKEAIDREYKNSIEAERLGLPVPRVGAHIREEDRDGIVFERISGISMLQQLMSKPWIARGIGKKTAQLQYQIHQCRADGLFSMKDYLSWNIGHTEYLTEKKKQEILNHMDQLPNESFLCHGDLHPGNIIDVSGNPYILDWMTATIGNPAADVARTLLLLKDSSVPGKLPHSMKLCLKIIRNIMASAYIKQYLSLSDITMEEINRWRIPIAAARLVEWVPEEERSFLLNLINKEKLR